MAISVERIDDTTFRVIETKEEQQVLRVQEYLDIKKHLEESLVAIGERHAIEITPLRDRLNTIDEIMQRARDAGIIFPDRP